MVKNIMEKELTILLVEDQPSERQAISDYIDTLNDVRLIGSENNSFRALEFVKANLPDAIILDLELHKGGGNGLLLLLQLKESNLSYVPYILVTTHNTSVVTYEQARQWGADFIMCKLQEDYSAKSVVEFLRSIKSSIHSSTRQRGIPLERTTVESLKEYKRRIRKRIDAEMDLIGINPKVLGRKYLLEAILILIEKDETSICTVLGQKFGVTDASVERAMQNAIDKAWRSSDIDDLAKYYTARINSLKGAPTITEFIYYYANKIKNDL